MLRPTRKPPRPPPVKPNSRNSTSLFRLTHTSAKNYVKCGNFPKALNGFKKCQIMIPHFSEIYLDIHKCLNNLKKEKKTENDINELNKQIAQNLQVGINCCEKELFGESTDPEDEDTPIEDQTQLEANYSRLILEKGIFENSIIEFSRCEAFLIETLNEEMDQKSKDRFLAVLKDLYYHRTIYYLFEEGEITKGGNDISMYLELTNLGNGKTKQGQKEYDYLFYFFVAQKKFEAKQYFDALDSCFNALILNNTSKKALNLRANIYGFMNEFDNAINDMNYILSISETSNFYDFFNRGSLFLKKGLRQSILSNSLSSSSSQVNQEMINSAIEDFSVCLDLLYKASDLEQEFFDKELMIKAYELRGTIYFDYLKDYQNAMSDFKNLIRMKKEKEKEYLKKIAYAQQQIDEQEEKTQNTKKIEEKIVKICFIVSNYKYESLNSLEKSEFRNNGKVTEIAKLLKNRNQFDYITIKSNVDLPSLKKETTEFLEKRLKILNSENNNCMTKIVTFFYFCSHGIQKRGKSLIFPVDMKKEYLKDQKKLEENSFNLLEDFKDHLFSPNFINCFFFNFSDDYIDTNLQITLKKTNIINFDNSITVAFPFKREKFVGKDNFDEKSMKRVEFGNRLWQIFKENDIKFLDLIRKLQENANQLFYVKDKLLNQFIWNEDIQERSKDHQNEEEKIFQSEENLIKSLDGLENEEKIQKLIGMVLEQNKTMKKYKERINNHENLLKEVIQSKDYMISKLKDRIKRNTRNPLHLRQNGNQKPQLLDVRKSAKNFIALFQKKKI